MLKRTTPPDRLREKQPVVNQLRKDLRITRWHAYGLLKPTDYPDAIPANLFDTRSDLAERVAAYAEMDTAALRNYYARIKERAA